MVYDTSKFLTSDPLDPRKKTIDLSNWFPTIREFKGKIVPENLEVLIYFGDLDEKTNGVKPIFLWKIRELKKPFLKDNNGDGVSEMNTSDEIKAFLKALKERDKFGNQVASHPVLMKGGFLYQLGKKGDIEKIKHEQAGLIEKNSSFFLRKVLSTPTTKKGNPFISKPGNDWESIREKLERLLSVR